MSDPRRAPRAYRSLVKCLPKDFRARFGRDMEEVFLHRIAGARSSSAARAWVWARHGVADPRAAFSPDSSSSATRP